MLIMENTIGFKNVLTSRKVTKRIVLHHSASDLDTTIYDINRWHLGNGWSGIGYHYVIYADGTIYRGRPENKIGAHAYQDVKREANSDGIGICMIGNFQYSQPTGAQMNSLVELIKDIRSRYPNLPVIGHKDVMATACPGKLFPWDDLYKRLEGNKMAEPWKEQIIDSALKAGLITERHNPDDAATKWFVLTVILNLLKKLGK